jgi:hypothetical protein
MPYSDAGERGRQQLREFIAAALERFSCYRDHKESMAWGGLLVYAGAAATALVSKDWPPSWGQDKAALGIAAFSVLWLLVLFYLEYQLRRRRWAALRVAGCDWLLASWLPDAPPPERSSEIEPSKIRRLINFVWPVDRAVTAIDRDLMGKVYPPEIETAWINAEFHSTGALRHERLIYFAGWLLYAAVIVRTCLSAA